MTTTPDTIFGTVLRHVLKPLLDRLDALESRIVALEQREDVGVWEPGRTYPKYAGVTHDGHYWFAQAQTSEAPGEGCPAWRLAVRRGKQGREGKRGPAGPAGRCAHT